MTDTATYRWKLEKEQTIVVPEQTLTHDTPSAWYYEYFNVYCCNIDVNITGDEMKALVAEGSTVTVVCNGTTYKTPTHFLSGDMGNAWGFGNPQYTNIWPEATPWPDDSGEPFGICYDGSWYLFWRGDVSYCTVSAYIEGEPTALVSVGANANPLTTLEGGIVNGLFNNARYQLAKPFKLLHDKDWAVEWRMHGDIPIDSAMSKLWDESGVQTSTSSESILFRKTTKSITLTSFGVPSGGSSQTHIHHGVKLNEYGIEYTAEHLYRLQNKVNDDGTNMVWLYVDGKEIAPMRHTFANSVADTLTDWVVGRNFSFGYMGTPRYYLEGFIMDDIAVWESGANAVWPEPFDTDTFLSGLTAGLVGKGPADITPEDIFTAGYMLGVELRLKRSPDMIPIRGDASGLQYAFDQNTLSLDITDTGLEGDTFVLAGNTLTVVPIVIFPETKVSEMTENEYLMCNIASVVMESAVTEEEVIEMYNAGKVVTVAFNGVDYDCPVRRVVGNMDTVYGFGNPYYMKYHAEPTETENTGEPFAIFPVYTNSWYIITHESIKECTISVYI